MSLFSVNIFLEFCCAGFICCFRKKLKHYYLIVSLSKKAYAGHIHGFFCIPVFRLSTWKWKIFDILFLYPSYKQECRKMTENLHGFLHTYSFFSEFSECFPLHWRLAPCKMQVWISAVFELVLLYFGYSSASCLTTWWHCWIFHFTSY